MRGICPSHSWGPEFQHVSIQNVRYVLVANKTTEFKNWVSFESRKYVPNASSIGEDQNFLSSKKIKGRWAQNSVWRYTGLERAC